MLIVLRYLAIGLLQARLRDYIRILLITTPSATMCWRTPTTARRIVRFAVIFVFHGALESGDRFCWCFIGELFVGQARTCLANARMAGRLVLGGCIRSAKAACRRFTRPALVSST
nr:MAG TPA: hypothetical protein [Caudoviricetes sp.]